MSAKNNSQFPEGDYTLNSPKPEFVCSKKRPCKRIVECSRCRQIRGDFFVRSVERAFSDISELGFLTLVFTQNREEPPWSPMRRGFKKISRIIAYRKMRPYLGVMSRGDNGNTHSHLILPLKHAIELLNETHKKDRAAFESRHISPVTKEAGGIFGLTTYLWINAIAGFSDLERPKGTRVIRASRGLIHRFPTGDDWDFINTKRVNQKRQWDISVDGGSKSDRKHNTRRSLTTEDIDQPRSLGRLS